MICDYQESNLKVSVNLFCTVGKTSLITRFMYDSFDNTYQVIISVIHHNITQTSCTKTLIKCILINAW